jgi:hypothetical protein
MIPADERRQRRAAAEGKTTLGFPEALVAPTAMGRQLKGFIAMIVVAVIVTTPSGHR